MEIEETKRVRRYLINEIRQSVSRIGYKELIEKCELAYMPNSVQMGNLLRKISDYEKKRGRPMLSALIVRQDTGLPGEGFDYPPKEINATQEEQHENYINLLHDFWSVDENYSKAFSDDEGL
jgi:hypothetical protein